ncbi:MAG TPA: hypothetical protein VMY78_06410 [Solirubrobacteraceae bacterium]|nr:hypothetical protein [Solirubrobacteraceae bacterium]
MSSRASRIRLVFALLAVAVVFMLGFEATITRIIGVLALFGFVVAGAFAIADHEFLDPEADAGETAHGESAVRGTRPAEER